MKWNVEREWDGETAFVICGGTSVAGMDLSCLKGRKVVAVNSSYEVAPFADILFFGDQRWWSKHRSKVISFKGRIATASARAEKKDPKRLLLLKRRTPPPGLVVDSDCVVMERTSLQAAMNLLVHLGVKRIVLIGADMRRGADGKSHHHSPHPWKNKPGDKSWDLQMKQLQLIVDPLKKLQVEVINTSMISRLPWWPKMTLEEAIAKYG
jgi:hypothetical protein